MVPVACAEQVLMYESNPDHVLLQVGYRAMLWCTDAMTLARTRPVRAGNESAH